MSNKSTLLVSTRKGLIEYRKSNELWEYATCHFKAIPVTIAYEDPRNGTWWAGLDHGHWGVKLNRSSDRGKTWEEIKPPVYPEGSIVKADIPAKTEYFWAITDGGAQYPNRIWIGTIPGGLFKSEDNGDSWELCEALWNHPSRMELWFGAGFDHPGIHSIIVDPRDNDHITIGASVAGVFETHDGGLNWTPKNKGLRAEYLPETDPEVGHDPHILVSTKNYPDILWQQNHCGIYRSNDASANWKEVGKKGTLSHFGFALATDESDPNTAWVAPAIADEYRIAVEEALAICRTTDGGKTWQALRNGLPQENCFDIVYRHGLAFSGTDLAFGTTTGNLFISSDRGDHWKCLSNYLPLVHAVCFAE